MKIPQVGPGLSMEPSLWLYVQAGDLCVTTALFNRAALTPDAGGNGKTQADGFQGSPGPSVTTASGRKLGSIQSAQVLMRSLSGRWP